MREPDGAGGVPTVAAEDAAERETPELVRALRAGDPRALDAVARRHAPRLFRFALRLTGGREEAEDLVQETLVRTLAALKGFEGRSRLSTYLVRALGNLWKNRLRSRSRSRVVAWFRLARGPREVDGEEREWLPADDGPSPLDALEAQDRASAVRRAVLRLEPNRRLTLLLREVEELSYEEIARVTGVAVGTVRSRLARAREDLRHLVEDEP